MITGSGTSVTSTRLRPIQHVALTVPPRRWWWFGSLGSGAVGFLGVGGSGLGSLLGALPTGVRSLGTGVGAQHLAGLEDLLEPAQGILEPATGVGADHRGQLLADTASGVGAER